MPQGFLMARSKRQESATHHHHRVAPEAIQGIHQVH
jgi:hypothetical protein